MIVIDNEFKSLIPPLQPSEYEQLEANLLADGCRDPLVLWGDILVDGHNRYEICNRLKIPFEAVQGTFRNREEVILWIIRTQLGRRNLSDYDRVRLALRLKPVIQAQARENQLAAQNNNSGRAVLMNSSKQVLPTHTRKMLADISGKSEDTIQKVELIEERATPEVKQALANQEISIHAAFQTVKKKQRATERQQNKVALYAPIASNITLIQGDMLTVIPTLNTRYQLVIADPPYNVTNQEWDQFDTSKDFLEQTCLWLDTIQSVLDDKYHLFWFCFPTYAADVEFILRDRFPIQSRIVWHRRNMSMGSDAKYKFLDSWEMCFHCGNRPLNYPDTWDDSRFDVMTYAVPQSNFEDAKLHPTQKPLGLIERLVEYGSYPDDHMLDPFAGSGTTGEAALSIGNRQCTLIEREGAYVDVIKGRLGL